MIELLQSGPIKTCGSRLQPQSDSAVIRNLLDISVIDRGKEVMGLGGLE